MKKLIFLLMLIPFSAMALCLDFYLDKNGQLQSVKCGSQRPELKCKNGTYWDGKICRKVEIIKICKRQGGVWKQVQLRVARMSDAFEPGALARNRSIINMCVCPHSRVWDGKECRSDVPLAKQCTPAFGNTSVRMTEEFFGSKDCPRVQR